MSGPLLVTGGSGYLGGELLRLAAPAGAAGTHLTSEPGRMPGVEWLRLDVRDDAAVDEAVGRLGPRGVIHTAYRQDGPGASETNEGGSAAVARACAARGIRLVHLSTDVVFDGREPRPYTETDAPVPVTDYGRSKARAERLVLGAHPAALVVRTSLMVGGAAPGRHERAVLEAARGRAETTFFVDEWRSPVLVGDLAAALLELAGRSEAGLLHAAGPEAVNRLELARRLARAAGVPDGRLRGGLLSESGLVRPANCVLDSSRARQLLVGPLRGVGALPDHPPP